MAALIKIIIGYDGSVGAEAVLDGLPLAGLPPVAEALVITVAEVGSFVPLPGVGSGGHGTAKSAPACEASRRIVAAAALEAERTAAQGAQRLRVLMPQWRVGHAGRHGAAHCALVEEAETWRADVVSVGSHGRSPIGRLLLGSVSHFVVEHAPCSVRVGRHLQGRRRQAGEGVRLLLAIDGSDGASTAVDEVLGRTWPQGTEVRLIVVVDLNLCASLGGQGSLEWLFRGSGVEATEVEWPDWPRRLLEPAEKALTDAGIKVSLVVLGGDAKHVIPEEAARWGADCIFLGATGHSRSERFLLGSVSSAVASRARCSVEVVRRGRRDGPSHTSEVIQTRPALRTREVLEQDWPAFADQFSRLHKGQLVTVETFARDLGAQVNVRDVPLIGIIVERVVPGECRVVIAAGDSPDNQFAHLVDRPSRVRVAEWNDVVSSALQIESADGSVALVHVGPAEELLPPGFITDGIILPPHPVKCSEGT